MFRKTVPLILVALAIAACGGTAASPTASTQATAGATPETTTGGDGSYPIVVDAANGRVEISARPEAIISLSPTATEMLFAIGAGDQIVAVDSLSNFPPEAPVTDLAAFTPNTEAIASYRPDLVVVAFDANQLLAGLNELGIPNLLMSAAVTIDDVYNQVEQLGAATGHDGEATDLVEGMSLELAEIAAAAPQTPEPLTYYYELDPNYFSVTSTTFLGSLLATLGLQNIADPADADGSASGYPQLSSEFIVAADPDLILLADTKCCGQDAATVAARPGWEGLTAVTSGGVVELDDDVASRWGPRIVDLLSTVATRLAVLDSPQ